MQEAYNAGYEDGKNKLIEAYNEQVDKFNALADKYNKQGQVLKIELEENRSLVIENKQLKKKKQLCGTEQTLKSLRTYR